MNHKTLVAVFAVLAGALCLGSYCFGYVQGKAAMDDFSGKLVNGVSASIRAESLQVIGEVIADLKESRNTEAQATLVRFARSQAKAVAECAHLPECSSLAAMPLPSSSALSNFGVTQ